MFYCWKSTVLFFHEKDGALLLGRQNWYSIQDLSSTLRDFRLNQGKNSPLPHPLLPPYKPTMYPTSPYLLNLRKYQSEIIMEISLSTFHCTFTEMYKERYFGFESSRQGLLCTISLSTYCKLGTCESYKTCKVSRDVGWGLSFPLINLRIVYCWVMYCHFTLFILLGISLSLSVYHAPSLSLSLPSHLHILCKVSYW